MYSADSLVAGFVSAVMLLSIAAGMCYAFILSRELRAPDPLPKFKAVKYKNQLGKALDDYKLSTLPNCGVEYDEVHYLEKFRELSSKDCYKNVFDLKDF